VEYAEGVPTEGGVRLAVLEQGSFLRFAAFGPLSESRWLEGVVVEVPCWRREVPEESWGVEGVVAASLVGQRSQGGSCRFP